MEFVIDSVRWKGRFPHKGLAPLEAYNELEKIRAKHGGTFSAEDIVQAASSRRSKLHCLFEWDDAEAGRQHRISQARSLQRSIEITYKGDGKVTSRSYEITTKQLPGNPASPRTMYTSFEDAMNDEATREALLADAIRQLMALRRRFRMLNELDRVFSEVDVAIEKIGV